MDNHNDSALVGELSCVSGPLTGRVYRLKPGVQQTLGRFEKADLHVPDGSVSRYHCRFESGANGGCRVVDLGSANGTYVNGAPAAGQVLAAGDRVTCGQVEFVFRLVDPDAGPRIPRAMQTIVNPPSEKGRASLSMDFQTDLIDAVRKRFAPSQTMYVAADANRAPSRAGDDNASLDAVCGLSEKLRRLRSTDEVLSATLEAALLLTRTNRAAVVLRERGGGRPRIAKFQTESGLSVGEFQVSLTVVEDVLKNNESLLIRDAMADERFKDGLSIMLSGIRSILCVPLGDERKAFGVLYADTTVAARVLTEDQLDLLSAIAHQTGVALERAWLVSDLQKLFIGAMHAMVRSLEAKDAYTRGHTGRVMLLALQLADRAGIDQADRDALELGGLMHDIGKIGVRDDILTKPGRLTPEEYDVIKNHPGIGAEILGGMPKLGRIVSLSAVIEAVRGHHERLDGKGYPDALTGDAVPRSARILAIADVWDALTTTRSYRKAMSRDEAWQIMENGRGSQFDPQLLTVFKGLVDANLTEDLSAVPTNFGLEHAALTSSNGVDTGAFLVDEEPPRPRPSSATKGHL